MHEMCIVSRASHCVCGAGSNSNFNVPMLQVVRWVILTCQTMLSSNVLQPTFEFSNGSVVLAAMILSSVTIPPYCATYITGVWTPVKHYIRILLYKRLLLHAKNCTAAHVATETRLNTQHQNRMLQLCSEQLLMKQHGD